jgi:integrase
MGRRGNGEGTITRRKDGRWEAKYTVHTAKGPKRRAFYGRTRAEVAEKLTTALSDRSSGLANFDAGSLTVGEYVGRWLSDSVRGSVRTSTHASYERQLRRYVVPALGRVKLKQLTAAHVQGLYRSMQDSGLSPRTVRYAHAVLRRALKQAVRWGMIPRNPCDDTDLPKASRNEMRPLDRRQARRLLGVARSDGDRLEALWVLAVHTGMRPGELLGLKWEDMDLGAGALQVKRALSPEGRFAATKTARSRRRIDLTSGSVEALQRHREAQLEERIRRAGLWQDQDLVFPSSVGTPLSHRNVVRAFKALLRRAELPETTRFYDLRHTCATLLLSRNVHPKYVQELLGHASIALTLDIYSHVLPGMGGASSAMEEALG